MKNRTAILWGAFALVLALVLVAFLFWPVGTDRPQSSGTGSAGSGADTVASSIVRDASSQNGLTTPRGGVAKPQHLEELPTPELTGEKIVRLRRDQILAVVNGVAITLKDLMPLGKDQTEGAFTEEDFEAKLQKAIDRELTFQAARLQKIGLSNNQEQLLDKAVENYKLHLQEMKDQTMLWTSITDETIRFELRDTTALMLQDSLLRQWGQQVLGQELSPVLTPEQVESHYQMNIAKYGVLPTDPYEREAAWQKIDYQIRQEIYLSSRQQYQQQLREYLDQLRASASITINQPS